MRGWCCLPFIEHRKFNRDAFPPTLWIIENKIQRTNLLIEKSLVEIDDAINVLRTGYMSLDQFQEIARKNYNAIRDSQEEFLKLNHRLMGFS